MFQLRQKSESRHRQVNGDSNPEKLKQLPWDPNSAILRKRSGIRRRLGGFNELVNFVRELDNIGEIEMVSVKPVFAVVFSCLLFTATQSQASSLNDALSLGLELLAIESDVDDLQVELVAAYDPGVDDIVDLIRGQARYSIAKSLIDEALDDLNDAVMAWYFSSGSAVDSARLSARLTEIGSRIPNILDWRDSLAASVATLQQQ